jgi:hypothetical protein|nr:MAG TPA: hypothetical protein [Caudoviricetes sp.]
MENIDKYKDWILKLAEEEYFVEFKEYSSEQKALWRYLFGIVMKDGYVKDKWKIRAGILLSLTDDGEVFLLNGGYSRQTKDYKKEKAIETIKSMAKDSIIEIFGNIKV